MSRAPRAIIRASHLVRDSWSILGLTLVLILALEATYRLQAAVRRPLLERSRAVRVTPAPSDTIPWFAAYREELSKFKRVEWEPYVYFRNPLFRGRYITIDSAGDRVTPQAPSPAGAPVTRVAFFGGSTMFGWYERDEHTIPADIVRRLDGSARDGLRIHATNYGVPGRTFTQEVLKLALLLRSGVRPDVVVFYDGINDVASAVQSGEGGMPLNEMHRVEEFTRGREFAVDTLPGLPNDARALLRGMRGALFRLEIAQRVVRLRAPKRRAPVPAGIVVARLVRMYAENARLVEALSEHYGFRPVYLWQPAIASRGKPLTVRERELVPAADIDSVRLAAPALLRAAMPAIVGDRFIDATALFATDSLDVYLDPTGHTYERANARIVDTLLPALEAASHAIARNCAQGRAHPSCANGPIVRAGSRI